MSRPFKRPRLHFLGSISPDPDGELAVARARNDGLLKTRWENIFQRYEKDFDGIGDEISMLEDEIVVDNGHIKSMQNAKDTGTARIANLSSNAPQLYDGRRILRAMTVAPSEDSDISIPDIDAEEVLQSIETIADNIVMSDDTSDDDLFDPSQGNELDHNGHLSFNGNIDNEEEIAIKSESETDSLFDNRPIMRSPSIDDLFVARTPFESYYVGMDHRGTFRSSGTLGTSMPSLPPDGSINRDIIRQEIRKALEEKNQAQEARIEPAWRIPIRLPSMKPSNHGLNLPPPSKNKSTSSMSNHESETDDQISVWQPPARTRRSRRDVAAERNIRRLRAESEDPLQDGFTSEKEEVHTRSSSRTGSSSQQSQPSSRPRPSDREVSAPRNSQEAVSAGQSDKRHVSKRKSVVNAELGNDSMLPSFGVTKSRKARAQDRSPLKVVVEIPKPSWSSLKQVPKRKSSSKG